MAIKIVNPFSDKKEEKKSNLIDTVLNVFKSPLIQTPKEQSEKAITLGKLLSGNEKFEETGPGKLIQGKFKEVIPSLGKTLGEQEERAKQRRVALTTGTPEEKKKALEDVIFAGAATITGPGRILKPKAAEKGLVKQSVEATTKTQSPILKATTSKESLESIVQPSKKLAPKVDTSSLPDIITPRAVRGNIEPPPIDFTKAKDKRFPLLLSRETMERNIEDVFEGQSKQVKEFMVDPVRANETSRIEFLNQTRDKIENDIVKGLKIKSGSKEDALIQRFGEGNITLEELMKETPKYKEVAQASGYFKGLYGDLLNQVNTVRNKFGYEPIPKRKDYFRHFQEIDSSIRQFGLIFKKEQLPTEISGLTSIFTPGKPFSTAELARTGGKYTESAIKGMDNYLDTITGQIYHIDSVQRARGLEKYIRDAGGADKANLPNFVSNIHEYGNLIAGKKGSFDRSFESLLGREIYGVVNFLRTRTSANMIAGNVSSAIMNFVPFTQSLATTGKQYAARGILDAMGSPFQKKLFDIGGQKSSFLTRRFPKDPIHLSKVEKGQKATAWLFDTVDRFTARSTVAMKYFENLSKGIPEEQAMKQADEYAGKVLADRSFGNLPNLMGQRALGFLTQFQVEINNIPSFLAKDIPHMSGSKTQVANALAQFTLYSYLWNSMMEEITGRRPTLDPIQYALGLLGKTDETEDKNFLERAGQVSIDLAENMPFTGGITGGRFPISAGIPDVPALIKGETTLKKEVSKPGFYLAPPFGGGQLKKLLEGGQAFIQGYGKSASGRVRYPVEQSSGNLLKSLLFGQYATGEAQEYFDKDRTPLGEKQTEKFLDMSPKARKRFYDSIIKNRELDDGEAQSIIGFFESLLGQDKSKSNSAKIKIVNPF